MRPRDAASLILHRQRDGHHEVLMGRRPRGSRFMPGVYVFPGGAVEPCDRRVRPSTPLDARLAPYLKVGRSTARARAMAVTAVRETFEETGLMVGAPGDPGIEANPLWAAWQRAGQAPDLACLDLMARAITPPQRPIRFHARFFLAHARHASGAIGGDGELEDVGWVRLEETCDLPLAAIQGFLIRHIRTRLERPEPVTRRPLFSFRGGRRQVSWE